MMMSPGMTTDFLPQFKAIGQSLKKRFFRKPNIADAIEQYDNLGQDLQREGQYEFAGLCALVGSKCHETLSSPIEQANTLIKASKLFMEARNSEKSFENEGKRSINAEGNLLLAMKSMNQAGKIYATQQSYGLALMVGIKMGLELFKEKMYGEAQKCFKSCLEIAKTHFTFLDQLIILDHIVKCKIKTTDLESALATVTDTLTKFQNTPEIEVPKELSNTFVLRFEILRVLLLLVLRTESTDIARFIWPESSLPETLTPLNVAQHQNEEREQMIEYLKSLVIAVEHGSVKEISDIRSKLAYILTESEYELFSTLITLES